MSPKTRLTDDGMATAVGIAENLVDGRFRLTELPGGRYVPDNVAKRLARALLQLSVSRQGLPVSSLKKRLARALLQLSDTKCSVEATESCNGDETPTEAVPEPVEGWPPFVVADVVRLKSGGPKMTVCEVRENGNIHCVWFDANASQFAIFVPESLELIEPVDGNSQESTVNAQRTCYVCPYPATIRLSDDHDYCSDCASLGTYNRCNETTHGTPPLKVVADSVRFWCDNG